VLEVAIVGKQEALIRVDKPIAYLDINDRGSSRLVTGRKRNASRCDGGRVSQRDS
jgi:hypothetical protein